jgi:hypothetical protein
MKRSVVTAFIALLFSINLSTSTASAQCPGTTPDCPGTPWTFGGSLTMTIYNASTSTMCTYRLRIVTEMGADTMTTV